MNISRACGLLVLVFILTACGRTLEKDGPPAELVTSVEGVPDAIPKEEPRSKYGNPKSYVVFGKRYYTLTASKGFEQTGIASWYGKKFHGRRTSSGEIYDMFAMTATHKTLPLPTYAKVINLENGLTAIVKINDRGPFHKGRIIDLSYSAAKRLDVLTNGTAKVKLIAIDPQTWVSSDGAPVDTSDSLEQPKEISQGTLKSQRRTTTILTEDGGVLGNRLFVQVGAFSIRASAEQIRDEVFVVADKQTRVTKIMDDGEIIYRVQIGPLTSVEEADEIIALLSNVGFPGLYLVLE